MRRPIFEKAPSDHPFQLCVPLYSFRLLSTTVMLTSREEPGRIPEGLWVRRLRRESGGTPERLGREVPGRPQNIVKNTSGGTPDGFRDWTPEGLRGNSGEILGGVRSEADSGARWSPERVTSPLPGG